MMRYTFGRPLTVHLQPILLIGFQPGPASSLQSVKQAKVSNYLVVAIDTALRDQLEKEGIPVYYRDVKVCLCPSRIPEHAAPVPVAPE